MAVIGREQSRESLDRGRVVSYPSGTPVGAAISEVGHTISGVTEELQKRKETADNFQLHLIDQQFGAALDGELEASAQNIGVRGPDGNDIFPASGDGFHDHFVGAGFDITTGNNARPGSFDELAAQYRERLPESVRGRFDQALPLYRIRTAVAADKVEKEAANRWYDSEVEKSTEKLLVTASQIDPNDQKAFGAILDQGIQIIESTGLPENDQRFGNTVVKGKARRIQEWREGAATALALSLKERNPAALAAALGIEPPKPAASGDVISKIIGVESGGDPNAANPNSSARGPGQFTNSTWIATVRQYEPELGAGKSRAEVLALRNNTTIATRMVGHLAEQNSQALQSAGVPVTDGTIYLAHFAGSQGAIDLLKADPSRSAESVLGENVIAANPFLRGKTAADVIAWADQKMGSATVGVSDRADPRFQDIPLDKRFQLYRAAKDDEDKVNAVERVTVAGLVSDDLASMETTGQGVGGVNADRVTAALGEQKALQWQQERQDAANRFRATDGMDRMTDSEFGVRLEELAPAQGAPGYDAALKTYDAATKQVEKTRKERATDPAQSVATLPEVKQAAAAWDVSTPQARASSWHSMLRARISAQDRVGIPPSLQLPLTDAEADQFAAPIKAASALSPDGLTGDWTGMVDQLASAFKESFGEYQDEAFRQVMAKLVGGDDDKALYASRIVKSLIAGQTIPLTDVRRFDDSAETARIANAGKQLSGESDRNVIGQFGPVPEAFRRLFSPRAGASSEGPKREKGRVGSERETQVLLRPQLNLPAADRGDIQYLKDHPETLPDFISTFGENAVPQELRRAR